MKAKAVTAKMVEQDLFDKNVCPDKVFKYKGEFIAKWFFFYRSGKSSKGKAEQVKAALPQATVTDHQEVWNAWPKDSWFEVRFQLENV
jgi:hypothetical protein